MNTQAPVIPDTQPADPLSPEVVAFCGLLARIMYRCLQEQDPRILSLIGESHDPSTQGSEVSHEHAA
jgi:hypothetical protein